MGGEGKWGNVSKGRLGWSILYGVTNGGNGRGHTHRLEGFIFLQTRANHNKAKV